MADAVRQPGRAGVVDRGAWRRAAARVVAQPGEEVQLDLIRGPGFTDKLAEKLSFSPGPGKKDVEIPIDPKARSARLKVPDGMEGWIDLQTVAGARALVYVPPH